MARRSGPIGWFLNAIRGLAGVGGHPPVPPSGGGGGGATVPPPPPPPPPPSPGGAPPPFETPIEIVEERDNVLYTPAHMKGVRTKSGKTYNAKVTGRWTVGSDVFPPDVSDVRDLYGSAGKMGFVSVVVSGAYYIQYPGQENEPITYLSYVFNSQEFGDAMNNPDNASATDVLNELIAPLGEWWEEVYEVSILDN